MIVLSHDDDTPSPTFAVITFLTFIAGVSFVAGWIAHAVLR